jgi:hypothetical protein
MDKTEKIFSSINMNTIKPQINEIKSKDIVLLKQSNSKTFYLQNLWILFIIILPLSGIIIGIIFQNDCPLEKYIPIWEIINGFMTISFLLLMYINNKIIHPNWAMFIIDQLKILLIFLLFVWFIRGNVSLVLFVFVYKIYSIILCQIWVYKYYKIVKYDKSLVTIENFYCNKFVYLYAFWYMTIIYILLGVCLIYFIFSLIHNCINKQRE